MNEKKLNCETKGIKIVISNKEVCEDTILKFNTIEEAFKHFDDLYMNAVEENYAEEVLYPILCAIKEEEYDYIDDEGYAVIEQDSYMSLEI